MTLTSGSERLSRLVHWLARFSYRHPLVPLALLAAITAIAAIGLRNFSLDASPDSLSLENDPDLAFYARTRRDLSSDEYIIVSISLDDRAAGDFFTPDRVAYLKDLAARLGAVPAVDQVGSMLDIPLLRSPLPVDEATMARVRESMTVLLTDADLRNALEAAISNPVKLIDERCDLALAREELLDHEAAAGNLVSLDGRTVQMQVFIQEFRFGQDLHMVRNGVEARVDALEAANEPVPDDLRQLERDLYRQYLADFDSFTQERRRFVKLVEDLIARESTAQSGSYVLRISGLPTLVEEMVDSLANDMAVFGITSAILVSLVLLAVFRRVRWVLIPMVIGAAVVCQVLGAMSWGGVRITLVTANIVSLLFIITMAHAIHLVVYLQELQAAARDRGEEDGGQPDVRTLLGATLRRMFKPCLFTALTTCVGFGSLVVSDIRPVMDFGIWMAVGTVVALLMSFAMFPLLVLLFGLAAPPGKKEAGRQLILRGFANLTLNGRRLIPVVGISLVLISAVGIARLSAEMKLIDYFHTTSPTHQGLAFIDREMGGTTTLEVIIESPQKGFFFSPTNLEKLDGIIEYLNARPEIGNVLSARDVLREVSEFVPHRMLLMFAMERLRGRELKDFISPDGTRARIVSRVRETIPGLDRGQLLGDTRAMLASAPELKGFSCRLTGIFVLYANMLESLVVSQVGSFAIVFGAVLLMLTFLFRSYQLGLIGMLPNVVPVLLVLGAMGFAGIPLNLVTIMIGSISLGIAVDGTIHYVMRYGHELAIDGDYEAATLRSHLSIGRAILTTAVAVIGGTWLMVLSDFVPTIWFGLFTGFALLAALFGALTILPAFILIIRPFRKRHLRGTRKLPPAPTTATAGTAPTSD